MKHPALSIYTESPLNIGTPTELLAGEFLTPTDRFFVRSHAPIPQIDPQSFRLKIGGLVDTPMQYTLDALQTRFASHTVPVTLQCAGIRRVELDAHQPIPGELLWNLDAIGTAQWSGVRLCDVLAAAGIQSEAVHVAFAGGDLNPDGSIHFGASIPLEKALSEEVLLAYAMNDQPLPLEHGYPLRLLVPGYIGARSVKWLTDIHVQTTPSANYYQAKGYKRFPPEMNAQTVDWNAGEMLAELFVNSLMLSPANGDQLPAGQITLSGFAIAGGENLVERVEISLDGGSTWQPADLKGEAQRWVWRFWQASVNLPRGTHELVVRAFDSGGNAQPEEIAQVWNFKGYMNNAYQRVRIEAL